MFPKAGLVKPRGKKTRLINKLACISIEEGRSSKEGFGWVSKLALSRLNGSTGRTHL